MIVIVKTEGKDETLILPSGESVTIELPVGDESLGLTRQILVEKDGIWQYILDRNHKTIACEGWYHEHMLPVK